MTQAVPRAWLVLAHRWLGLVSAAFLLLAGLTGSLLAYHHELDAALNPQWLRVQQPRAEAPLDPLLLRERVLQAHPEATLPWLPLQAKPGEAQRFWLAPKPGVEHLDVDEVFVDPWSGEILGARHWGHFDQGWRAGLMPFIYRLHDSLALGEWGKLALGIVALIWAVDCVVGAWLTLPPRGPRRLARWGPAWKLRWRGAGWHKRLFDWHRATGLWPWALLFVLAWSSVSFNLDPVYSPVMRGLFAHQDGPARASSKGGPELDWDAALVQARARAAEAARQHGFTIEHEVEFSRRPGAPFYQLRLRTDRDLNERRGATRLWIGAQDGRLLGLFLPRGAAAGDTVSTWLVNLHLGTLWGRPYQALLSLSGLLVAALSASGVYLWWRKRGARRKA
ncbi:PepSY domain-containing protein [Roseateles sp. DAIF2]|uniref:PepSY-associated TM helix domain-containing protein n=1 Tax=Roseateles sp. DAIF2 TaxID=2714952 RepID=UPI0018A2F51C|nr:PepSY-associated TM helix domain-containing protein [Roseateles sp. DAIF2]QPF75696.1 PepSY domain-containing protein [Roseateles sp. DAIF2]